jgi:hypothetical protein
MVSVARNCRNRVGKRTGAQEPRNSDQHLRAWPFTLPFVVFAKHGHVLLDLCLDLGKGRLYTLAHIGALTGGVQCARGKRKIQGKQIHLLSGMFLGAAAQLHQVRRIPFQQLSHFHDMPQRFFFDRFPPFFELTAN